MPELTTGDAIRAHARAVWAAGTHWVILADDGEMGTAFLAGLHIGLALRGVPPDAVAVARFEFFNLPTRHRGTVSLLTVPKTHLPRAALGAAMRGAGYGVGPDADQDSVMVGAPGSRELLMAAMLDLSGRGVIADPPARPEVN